MPAAGSTARSARPGRLYATRAISDGTRTAGHPRGARPAAGEAEVILGGFPFPLDLRARAPRLRWFHQRPAGASNLLIGDLWGSDVVVTTSRGTANSVPIAEYAIACDPLFRQGFHRAAAEREAGAFDHRAYARCSLRKDRLRRRRRRHRRGSRPAVRRAGDARRRHAPRRRPGEALPAGFSEIGGAGDLDRFLPQSDFVAVCCQWTPETTGFSTSARFAAMKPGSVLVNVARGEIVDEDALADALERGICAAPRSTSMSASSSARRRRGCGPTRAY